MTWEGGWDYSEALLVRAVWGLDHTTPHHTTPHHTTPHHTTYTTPYIYTHRSTPIWVKTRFRQKNLANRFIGLKIIFQSGSIAAAW